MYEIEPASLRTAGEAIVVDVREPSEFATGSVPGGMWAWTALESADAGESR